MCNKDIPFCIFSNISPYFKRHPAGRKKRQLIVPRSFKNFENTILKLIKQSQHQLWADLRNTQTRLGFPEVDIGMDKKAFDQLRGQNFRVLYNETG